MTEEPASNRAGHGAALLLIDVVNDLAADDGDNLLHHAENAIDAIVALRDAARAAGLPIVHVNDHFGHWRAGREEIVAHCMRAESVGRHLVERLRPSARDYFVVKPHFSGFYATLLAALLPRLGVQRLILAGIAADICVLFTAADAHMREYELWVPADAVVGSSADHRDHALEIMRKSMGAETRTTADLPLADWLGRS